MSNPTTTPDTGALNGRPAPEAAPKRGMLLPCPLCGQEEATITVSLADGESMFCADCSSDFSLDLVRGFVAKWSRMIAYIEAMPGEAS